HAQIFFSRNQYWIKDLTGQRSIQIDGRPIENQSAMGPNCRIALSPLGPTFQFIGEGRLIEVQESLAVSPTPSETIPDTRSQPNEKPLETGPSKGVWSAFKRFLDK
ncbi:MAG: FHA domain-containing protein, partial [Pseudomonadota bacterium]